MRLLLLALMGCPYIDEAHYAVVRDADRDGQPAIRFGGSDCDDNDPSIGAGFSEIWYDGIDQDCAGDDDLDQDGDGFQRNVDCDDTQSTVNPDAEELCDGLDNDCDGLIDDDDQIDEHRLPLHFVDRDGDGIGGGIALRLCTAPPGTVPEGTDCDDNNPAIAPGLVEVCDTIDRNCDGDPQLGAVDALPTFVDADGDGFGADAGPLACNAPAGFSTADGDCDDSDPNARPGELGSVEVCDGFDNDCNGLTDDDDPHLALQTTLSHYPDNDGDGYGDPAGELRSCVVPAGRITIGGDCNDGADSLNPGADEICDGLDNDCDQRADNAAIDASLFYVDGDGDGYGSAVTVLSCDADPPGVALAPDDCDDGDAFIRPGALEICGDGILQDCNVTLDDCDGDGTPDVMDCQPTNPAISPTAIEICDGLDNDCDTLIDADDPDAPSDVVDYFLDDDGDGFGSNVLVGAAQACTAPPNGVTNTNDCDDEDPTAYPGNLERCDAVDNDCNGQIDDGQPIDPPTFWFDFDRDGFGVLGQPYALACVAPGGLWADAPGDCDDLDPTRNPGENELCDGGVDNDCDGLSDLDDPDALLAVWYFDGDLDGYGDIGVTLSQCGQPAGYVLIPGDCDDADPLVNPDATATALAYLDADGDGVGTGTGVAYCGAPPAGHVASNGDCNDADPYIYPGQLEFCDTIDNDCDGDADDADLNTPVLSALVAYIDTDGDGYRGTPVPRCAPTPLEQTLEDCDETVLDGPTPAAWWRDADEDSFGTSDTVVLSCNAVFGYVLGDPGIEDCNDDDAHIHPSLPDNTCNRIDEDCDGVADEDHGGITFSAGPDEDRDGWPTAHIQSFCSTDALSPQPPLPVGWALTKPHPFGHDTNPVPDCDDRDANVNPGIPFDFCSTPADDNCSDGLVLTVSDWRPDSEEYWPDHDGDGLGDQYAAATQLCHGESTAGMVPNDEDCNDLVGWVGSAYETLDLEALDITLAEAFEQACDGHRIRSGDQTLVDMAVLNRDIYLLVEDGNLRVDVSPAINVSMGRLELRNVNMTATTDPSRGLQISGGDVTVEFSEFENLSTSIQLVGGTADVRHTTFRGGETGLEVRDGTLDAEDVTFEELTRAASIVNGMFTASRWRSRVTDEHLQVSEGGTAVLEHVEMIGGTRFVEANDGTVNITQAQMHANTEYAFQILNGSTATLRQGAVWDVGSHILDMDHTSSFVGENVTLVAGEPRWISSADANVQLNTSILMGHHTSAQAHGGFTLHHSSTNNAIEPTLESTGVSSNVIGLNWSTLFFRYGEPGCDAAVPLADLHPITPLILSGNILGWTGGTNNPETPWSDDDDGLPRGYRDLFDYRGPPVETGPTTDEDNLSAHLEVLAGTDPTRANTDGAGMDDGMAGPAGECAYGGLEPDMDFRTESP